MPNINRRKFIQKSALGVAGVAAIASGYAQSGFSDYRYATIDSVELGNTGLKVPRLALGTGSQGWKHSSNQARLGEKRFIGLARYAYDRGIRFFETADMYGTHELVGKAVKEVGRENVTILTKVMVYPHQDWYSPEPFIKSLDRFRRELDTEYIDIMLLHCMVNSGWPDEYKRYMEGLSEAKEKGIIGKLGLSCHDMGALKVGAESEWPDVILARINHNGAKMDGSPADIMPILNKAKATGKGVIGMKIFGCGDLVQEQEREKSLNYVIKSNNIDCMTIGLESVEQVDDAIERIMRIKNS
jgi:1-deoxyxylulose-5-phosphate synthase